MSEEPEYLEELYKRHVWQPNTQMKLAPPQTVLQRGEGVYLIDVSGRRIIDAIGSWWVNIHGHCHPHINAAIERQLKEMEHCIYAGFVHEPAVTLSERLSALTDYRLSRVFFSDNGSTAMEIAAKMSYQYFRNAGRPEKNQFVTLGGGYHGDTIGAMSLGARGILHTAFKDLCFPAHVLPIPQCPFEDLFDEDKARLALRPVIRALEDLFNREGGRLCAITLEPILQGASGPFNFYPPYLLRRIRELCDEHDVFWIADEVFTGFGRLGSFFACQKAEVWPDFMALAKGLSGGYFPIAATLTSERVFEGFYSDDRSHAFLHGHSMTASPLGCAAAHASLDLFDNEDALGQAAGLEDLHRTQLDALLARPIGARIKHVRTMGSVAALDLDVNAQYTSDFGWRLMQKAIELGVLLRPVGSTLYVTPPYCITESELAKVYEAMEAAALYAMG